jgi:hypothetical protein
LLSIYSAHYCHPEPVPASGFDAVNFFGGFNFFKTSYQNACHHRSNYELTPRFVQTLIVVLQLAAVAAAGGAQ